MTWRSTLMAAWLGLAACGWRGPAPIQALGEVDPARKVLVADEATWNAIAIRYLREAQLADGTSEVSMEIVNQSASAVRIRVSASFFDAAGQPTESTELWQRLEIGPDSSKVFSSTSVSNKAVRYTVSIEAQ